MALTGKTIGQLTYLSGVTSDTMFPVELSGITYHVLYSGITNPVDLSAVDQDILPASDGLFDLGSPELKWFDGYFSSKVQIGENSITSDIDGDFLVDTNVIVDGTVSANIGDFGDITIIGNTISSGDLLGEYGGISDLIIDSNLSVSGSVNSTVGYFVNGVELESSPMTVGTGTLSIVGNGIDNTASGGCSFVGGGNRNTASQNGSFVGGGVCNTNSGYCSFIGGGFCNQTFDSFSFLGGGSRNNAAGCLSFVGGGLLNFAGLASFVGGGSENNAEGGSSAIVGGGSNIANGIFSFIGGGQFNCTTQQLSTISGGYRNCVTGQDSFIGGGRCNVVSGFRSTVGGGSGNTVSTCFSTVGGGQRNIISGGTNSTVSGGFCNTASGSYSVIGGGRSNTANGACSGILGGCANNTCNFSNSFIIGSNICATQSDTTFVQGFSKTSGTFRISHPNPTKNETHYLQHSFVESPTEGDNIYRFVVDVVNGEASISLPDYYKFLNKNTQVWVTPENGFGIAYGKIDESEENIIILANQDMKYNVLVIGTRKDEDAIKNWNGIEIPKTNDQSDVVGLDNFTSY